jgi:hypothetical protein
MITYKQRQAAQAKEEAWVNRVNRSMPAYERQRPRDPDEAKVLVRLGTPLQLVGPVRSKR